jgi:peroxiredoxin
MLVFGWALVVVLGVLVYRLIVDRGRLLLQVEAFESRLGSLHEIPSGDVVEALGFPPGSPAPDFALTDLTGTERALEDWRGQQIVLVFFDLNCRFCLDLLPGLAAIRPGPQVVVLATGEPDRIRAVVEEHDLSCTVLLQQENEVSQLLRVPGTPAAYPVDENGLIAGPLALGSEPVLDLAAGRGADGQAGATTKLRLRPASESRLLRTGLKAGVRAPDFALPGLDGGTVSLADYRGRRVLLVLLDPDCAPCDQLAPELEQLHRERDDFEVLAISRGDQGANRAKAEQHSLTFPIALQRHWDTSKDYGMFAVPIAYMIDEDGVLVSNAAVGPEPILELAAEKEVSRA